MVSGHEVSWGFCVCVCVCVCDLILGLLLFVIFVVGS